MAESTTFQDKPPQQEQEKANGGVVPLGSASFEISQDEDEENVALLSHDGDGEDGTIETSTTLNSSYYEKVIQTRESRFMMFAFALFLVVATLMGFLVTSHGKGHPRPGDETLPSQPSQQEPYGTDELPPKQLTLPPEQTEQHPTDKDDKTQQQQQTNNDKEPETTPQPQTESPHDDTPHDTIPKIKYYCDAKTDRAGAQILDLLMMDSFIYHQGGVFGGACAKFDNQKDQEKFDKHLDDKMVLIRLLGLENLFKFACPTDQELASGQAKYLQKNEYHMFNEYFSMEWVNHVRAMSTFPYAQRDDRAPLQIAVHMRRGDYSPCRAGHGQKYLPNTYYLDVLDEYLPKYCPTLDACNLTIYTEDRAFEDFKPFEERNYHMDFDSSLEQIWTAFINADLLILSKSSFSWVPGIMNTHHVVTPEYKYPVCDNWDVASAEICGKSDQVVEGFVNNQCRRRMWFWDSW